MGASGVAERYAAAIAAWDLDALRELRDPDYLLRWPQSGELVRGRETIATLERADPGGAPDVRGRRRVAGRDELWTIEALAVDPDGARWHWVSIIGLKGERVVEETEYFCEPLPAPAWRARYVERFDGAAPPAALPSVSELSAAQVTRLGAAYEAAERDRDWATLATLRAPGWQVEWPQSGERIPDHAADVAIHSAYPGYPELHFTHLASSGEGWELTPLLTPIRVHGSGPMIVIEGLNTYANGERWFVVLLAETGDGKVRRETAYFARPFDAPAWRADLVEAYDPLAPR
ncbi:MAG: hypothetical protein ACXVAE_04070 [Candidatus Limnocylindrales bacterium]